MTALSYRAATLACVITAGSAACAAQAVPRYQIIHTTEGAPYGGSAAAINNEGVVTGTWNDRLQSSPYIHREGATAVLAGIHGGAQAINASGQIAGYTIDAAGVRHAMRYDTVHGLVDLGAIDPDPAVNSVALGISDAGDVCGWFKRPFENVYAAATSGGVPYTFSLPAGATSSQCNAMNAVGDRVGQAQFADFWATASYVAEGKAARRLPTLDGIFTRALAINRQGNITGTSFIAGSYEGHAFFYRKADGRIIDLGVGDFIRGTPDASGLAINAHDVVVGTTRYAEGRYRAFVHVQGRMWNLNRLLDPASAAAWVLTRANGINDAGQIVGVGVYQGVEHGFLLTPVGADSSTHQAEPAR